MKSVTDNPTNTREVILHAIKSSHEAAVNELAEAADVSPVTVRHHLNALQAEGLLTVRPIRRKVGRPYFVYKLTEKGHELFPQKYVRLSSRLLTELKARFPAGVVVELFDGVVRGIIDEHRGQFEHLPFEERLAYLVDLLGEEGFLAEWEEIEDGYRITEYNCPYLSIGEQHSEICTIDRTLIMMVLNTKIEQHRCVLNGAECCEFTFSGAAVRQNERMSEVPS